MDRRNLLSQGIRIFSIVPWENVLVRRTDSDLDKMEARLRAREQERAQGQQMPAAIPQQAAEAPPQIHESGSSEENVATACIPCSINHLAVSSGLLNEAVRFGDQGISSPEIADRISGVFQELGAMERVDLSESKIRSAPDWEQSLAREARDKSRDIRHALESVKSTEDLQKIAADAQDYYKNLNRNWFKRRIQNMSQEDKAKVAEKAMEKFNEEQE